MASLAERLPANVPGDFFVDATCIDCDACRQIAPAVFSEKGGQSAVWYQPLSPQDTLAAEKALLACPTGSIGTESKHDLAAATAAFPETIEAEVSFCGFTSEASFGALSYFVERVDQRGGNLLVDSPRFASKLVAALAERGGVAAMLLTHQDDVADHARLAKRFGCERIMHADDVGPATQAMERQPQGSDPLALAPDLLMIPTPGHTRGHAVYLYRERFLFTGDHLAWDTRNDRLYAFRTACWYSWSEQIRSMERLLDYTFEWVLPGHGHRIHLPPAKMRDELERCIAWMKEKE